MPVCVKESTGDSLIQRGWGNFVKTVNINNTESNILYDIRGGKLVHVTPKSNSFGNVTSFEFSIVPNDGGLFSARIPSDLLNTNPDYWREFVIRVDGVVTETEYWSSDHTYKLFSVSFANNTSVIEASLPVK
ncbi:hypothetical protein [Nitrosopumilus sp.]|uniref:hypothetical protein n=1 Tax=Nitrosopumilus sp. TaxID=2024843 RepID=UPI0034A00586